jgi:hypothetical protein
MTLNEASIETLALSAEPREWRWHVGDAGLVRGLNTVEMIATQNGTPTEFTLLDVKIDAGR